MFSLSALVTCRHPSALGTGIMHGCCLEFGEPPAAVRVPAWLPPDADRLHVGSPENDMNVLKEMVDRTLFFPWENTT